MSPTRSDNSITEKWLLVKIKCVTLKPLDEGWCGYKETFDGEWWLLYKEYRNPSDPSPLGSSGDVMLQKFKDLK